MSSEFDRLVAEFERFQSRIRQADDRFTDIDGMQTELAGLEATATSPDRAVTVVAGPGGSVLDVRFTEDALRLRPQTLSSAVMSTLQQAVADAARKQAGIVDAHTGGAMALGEQVLETQAELFGTTVEELRSRVDEAPAARHPEAAGEDDDDHSYQSFVRADDDQSAPAAPAEGAASAGDDFLQNLFDQEDHR